MTDGEILIWGEFLPTTHTGISVSNQILLHYLHSEHISPIQIEEYSWNKKNYKKLLHYFHLYCKVFKTICQNKIRIFYFTLPQSVLGGIKFLLILPVIKIISKKTIVKAHIHRGDFKDFIYKNKLNRLITKFDFWFIDEVIVLSPRFQKDVEEFSKKVKVRVLHNTSSFESSQTRVDRTYENEFICISNYIKSKGIQELVDCFRSEALKDCKLTIFGQPYDEKFYNRLRLLATQNVSIRGPLGRNDIYEELRRFNCLIMPSWNEGQPIVIIEAMSMAIPVIATNVGDIPYMLGEDYGFLAKPGNTESLLQTILAFIRFEGKSEISSFLYSRYLYNYSNEKYREKLLDIFN
jgi:glycosyltransferase involved in cell wall biosynthesis